MKRASQRQLPTYASHMSVTAWLDLGLVLLLVFVVAVPFLRREQRMPETLAASASEASAPVTHDPQKPQIQLVVQPDQIITLDGKKVSGEKLMTELRKKIQSRPDSGVLVVMPSNFAAGPLARLMEEMHKAGVKRTAVEVSTPGK